MASYTIGPVNCTGSLPNAYMGKVDLEQTVNAASNSSTIAWSFKIWATGTSSYIYTQGNQVTIVINSVTVINTANIGTVSLAGTSAQNPLVLKSGTTEVPHNTDGSKTLAVSATYRQNNADYLKTIPVNGSVELQSIPRVAVLNTPPALTLAATGTQTHTVTWTTISGYYYKVQYLYGDTPIHTQSSGTSGGSYTWSITSPTTVAANEINSKKMNVTVVLHTYTDSACTNEVGTSSKNFTITLGDSFAPSITAYRFFYGYDDRFPNQLISGLCDVGVSCMITYVANATIASSDVVYMDGDKELGAHVTGTGTLMLGKIPAFSEVSKTLTLAFKVTDTRGFTTSGTSPAFSAYGWSAPSVSNVSAYRCTSNGTKSETGGYYKVTFTYSIRPLGNTNAKVAAVSYKYISNTLWTQSSSGNVNNYSDTLTLGPYTLNPAQDEKLEIRVAISDTLSSDNATTGTAMILPAAVFIDIKTNGSAKVGLGIGTISDTNKKVQLGWDLQLKDENSTVRAELDPEDGLTFYGANGSELGNYPPDGSIIDLDTTLAVSGAAADSKAVGDALTTIRAQIGSPLVASTSSAMTDHTKIYVYTGTQSGYTAGNWYYWNGSSWVSGGVYNSSAVQLDSSLSILGVAADAKAVGDRFEAIENLEDLALSYNLELGGINSSGQEFGAGDGTYMRTPEYIPMETAQYMQFPSKGDPTGKALFVCYYNSNKAFVTRVQTVTDYAIDTQYAYIRLSFYMSSGNNESVYRTWVNWNVPSELVDTVNDMSAIVTGLVNTVQDISDEVNAIENLENVGCAYRLELGGINSSGQEFGENDGTYMRTPDFINMDKAQYMEFPSKGDPTGKALFICYYNSSKQFVTRVQTTTGYKLVTSYPYIRLSFYMSTGNNESVYRTWVNWDVPNRLTDTAKATFWYEYDSNTKTLTITGTKAKYIIKRVTDNSIHLDSWRLYAGYVLVGSNWFNMWTNSDAEGPIKIDNEADFISGYHGDEIYQSATLYIDNAPLNVSADESGRAESFMLCQTSTCYRVNSNTQAFTRYKKVSIQDNSFTVQQRWVAKVSCTVTRGALCLMQCYEDELVGWDTDLLLPMQSYTTSASLSKDTRIGNLYLNGGRKLSLIAERGADNEHFYPSANYYQDQSRVKYYFDMYNGKSLSIGDELISKFTVRVDDYSV